MLKLREAFSPKIHLHIRRDLLQQFWDKYVPEESSAYKHISLAYLGAGDSPGSAQSAQTRLLINLILKNRIMQIAEGKTPTNPQSAAYRELNNFQTRAGQRQAECSGRRLEKYCFTQLRCLDFQMYRILKRYVLLLDQTKEDGRRYQSWKEENLKIERQREQYRLFSLFFSKIKEYTTEYSAQTARILEKELIGALSEKEYHALSEKLIWQERKRFLEYAKTWDQAQCRQVMEGLEDKTAAKIRKEAKLSLLPGREMIPSAQVQTLPDAWPEKEKTKEMGNVSQSDARACLKIHSRHLHPPLSVIFAPNSVNVARCASLIWHKSSTKCRVHLPESIFQTRSRSEEFSPAVLKSQDEDILSGERLAAAAKKLEPEEFCRLFVQAARLEGAKEEFLFFQESRQEMLSCINEMEEEKVLHLWNIMEESVESEARHTDVSFTHLLYSLQMELSPLLLKESYQEPSRRLVWAERERILQYVKTWDQSQCRQALNGLEGKAVLEILQESMVRSASEQRSAAQGWERKEPFVLSGENLAFAAAKLESEEFYQFYEQASRLEGAKETILLLTDAKEWFRQMSGQAYQKASEILMWKERERLLEYAKTWDESQRRQIQGGLEGKTIIEVLTQPESTGLSGNEIAPPTVGGTESDLVFIEENAPKLQKRQSQVLLSGEKLAAAGETLGLEEFCLFYDQACRLPGAEEHILLIRREKEEMISSMIQMDGTKARAFWTQAEKIIWNHNLEQKLVKVKEQYFQEVTAGIWNQADALLEQEPFQFIADWENVSWGKLKNREDMQLIQAPREEIGRILADTEQILQAQEENIEQRQAQAYLTYRQEYDQVMHVDKAQTQEEKAARDSQKEAESDNRATKAKERARDDTEEKRILEQLFPSEWGSTEQGSEDQSAYAKLWEWGEALLRPLKEEEWEETDLLPAEQTHGEVSKHLQQEDVKTQVIRRQIEAAKDRNNLQRLIRQINHRAALWQKSETETAKKQEDLKRIIEIEESIRQLTKERETERGRNSGEEISYLTRGTETAGELPEIKESIRQLTKETEKAGGLRHSEEETSYLTREPEKAGGLRHSEEEISYLTKEAEAAGELPEIKESIRQLTKETEKAGGLRHSEEEISYLTKETEKAGELPHLGEEISYLTKGTEKARELPHLGEEISYLTRETEKAGELPEIKESIRQLTKETETAKGLPRSEEEISYLTRETEVARELPEIKESIRQLTKEIETAEGNSQPFMKEKDTERQRAERTESRGQLSGNQEIGEPKFLERARKPERSFQLMYTDGQLKRKPVQNLLRYMQNLDEEQYGDLVKRLTQITRIQWFLQNGEYQKLQRRLSEIIKTGFKHEQETFQDEPVSKKESDALANRVLLEQRRERQEYAAAYQNLANGIEEFERKRRKSVQKEIRNIEYVFSSQGDRQRGFPHFTGPKERPAEDSILWDRIDVYTQRSTGYQGQKLQYSMNKDRPAEDGENRVQMQKEASQLKSVQEELNRKLKEVEKHLQKVESASEAKEDVRSFAEQVKKQLYEELHVEKLRRGLV